jgi:L-aspartate oxidase
LPRIIHATDATGKAIADALLEALHRQPQVTLLSGHTALELIHQPGPEESQICSGAYLLDRATGQVIPCRAKTTILATGGLGQVFERTSNPPGARGDGVAMADRAGVRLADMEFIQFHPTTFAQPLAGPFLISEAVRGAGARLVNADGQPFMQRYAPEWKDLAPRDIVARSIQQEMMSQGVPHVYLDLRSYVPVQEIRSHFPTIYEYCLRYGVDITKDLVPVAPAAHYACGGVRVDEWGQTSLERLYAVGEVTCTGLHGANRLASTSLLEGLVWGHQAALHIREQLPQRADTRQEDILPYPSPSLERVETTQIERMVDLIKNLMWDYVGLMRTTSGLVYTRAELQRLAVEVELMYHNSQITDELIGLRNIARVALLITEAALDNPVSQGCHYRLTEGEERQLFSWKLQVQEPVLVGNNKE